MKRKREKEEEKIDESLKVTILHEFVNCMKVWWFNKSVNVWLVNKHEFKLGIWEGKIIIFHG